MTNIPGGPGIRVLCTGDFRFPEGDASARRIYGIAKLFQAAGYEVSFAGWEPPPDGRDHYRYHGHDCYPQGELPIGDPGALRRIPAALARGSRTARWLRSNRRFDIIVAMAPPTAFALRLLSLGRELGVRLVLDCVDWLEGSQLRYGRFGPAALEYWARMTLVYPRFLNVICISRLLERHFSGRNLVLIPPLMPRAEALPAPRRPLASGLDLLYAGSPGKKDRLAPFVAALPEIRHRLGREITLRIAGISRKILDRLLLAEGHDPSVSAPFVECLGWLTRREVEALYGRSHFSILFRADSRCAWAGFPTKAVESWASGCPVICNPVGDLASRAEHLSDVLFVEEARLVTDLPDMLRRVEEPGRYEAMAARCMTKARDHFSPEAHSGPFRQFLAGLR